MKSFCLPAVHLTARRNRLIKGNGVSFSVFKQTKKYIYIQLDIQEILVDAFDV